jgi:hypothetical protein
LPLSSNNKTGGEIKSTKINKRLLLLRPKFNLEAQNVKKMTYRNPMYMVDDLPSLRNENTLNQILG